MRIGLCGAFSTGKSTLGRELAKQGITYIPEHTRELIIALGKLPQEMDPQEWAHFQYRNMVGSINQWLSHEKYVSDTTPFEILAYSEWLATFPFLYSMAKDYLALYPFDLCFLLQPLPHIADDGLRFTDRAYQKTIQDRIVKYAQEFGAPLVELPVSRRLEIAKEHLQKF